MMMPIMQFVGNIGYVMVALLGGFMTIKGAIEVGDIQSFFQYIETLPSRYSRSHRLQYDAVRSSFRSVSLNSWRKRRKNRPPSIGETGKRRGRWKFEHVSFGYRPDQIIIKDFSDRSTGTEDRDRRSDWCRKNHTGETADAFL